MAASPPRIRPFPMRIGQHYDACVLKRAHDWPVCVTQPQTPQQLDTGKGQRWQWTRSPPTLRIRRGGGRSVAAFQNSGMGVCIRRIEKEEKAKRTLIAMAMQAAATHHGVSMEIFVDPLKR